MIKDIKSGLYLTETSGMGINTVTGDYSQGRGRILDRKWSAIAYPVSEITIAGHLKDMFFKPDARQRSRVFFPLRHQCADATGGKYDGGGDVKNRHEQWRALLIEPDTFILMAGALLCVLQMQAPHSFNFGYDIGPHMAYIRFVTDHFWLPQPDACYECHQPFLYYLVNGIAYAAGQAG